MNMTNSAVCDFETEALTASSLTELDAGFEAALFLCEAPEFAMETGYQSPTAARGPRLLRGALWGFCMEAAAAIFIYGIWHLWHLLR